MIEHSSVSHDNDVALHSSPCHVTDDQNFTGMLIDCSHKNITSLPVRLPRMPSGMSTLILASNSIRYLRNDSFSMVTTPKTLRHLDLRDNKIEFIVPYLFSNFTGLRILDLSSNYIKLDRRSLNADVLRGLYSLKFLALCGNQNELNINGHGYPDSLFTDLVNLEELTLDTFQTSLDFGLLINKTSKLSSILLCGGVTSIRNDSLESLKDIKLKSLSYEGSYLHTIEAGAFRFLQSLNSLNLSGSNLITKVVLESLETLANVTLINLVLNGLNSNYNGPEIFSQNIIITRTLARYLSNICVENFSITNSNIQIIQSGSLTTHTWARCLKNMDISGNDLSGEITEFLNLSFFQRIESFTFANRKYTVDGHVYSRAWKPQACISPASPLDRSNQLIKNKMPRLSANSSFQINTNLTIKDKRRTVHNPYFENNYSHAHSHNTFSDVLNNWYRETSSNETVSEAYGNFPVFSHSRPKRDKNFKNVIFLPPNLKFLNLNSMSRHLTSFHEGILFHRATSLEEVHLSDNGIRYFNGRFYGLQNIKLTDISKNPSTILIDFFDSIPSIQFLNMASTQLSADFMMTSSRRLLSHLTRLKVLDLSNNHLQQLANGTFANNTQLSSLILSGNLLKSLPFSLHYVPNLCLLDLTRNVFNYISDDDITALEAHSSKLDVPFSLQINGNEFYCGCQNIRFLSWLKKTHINLDNNRNYSCISNSGKRTNTLAIGDLEEMWRTCNGVKAFWITFAVVCLMLLGFVCAILIPKLKTRITAFILKTIWNPLPTKKPSDYSVGVYIGYADSDANLACLTLRPYIEKVLRLTTYVRHRDELPSMYKVESIIEAVYSSWRILLLLSDDFLEDYWSYFILKTSSHTASTENPGRLVLVFLYDENRNTGAGPSLASRLPHCFLHAVREENIIHMSRSGHIDCVEEQALVKALKSLEDK